MYICMYVREGLIRIIRITDGKSANKFVTHFYFVIANDINTPSGKCTQLNKRHRHKCTYYVCMYVCMPHSNEMKNALNVNEKKRRRRKSTTNFCEM